jgi:broad specificity phosphatase PhoE
LAAHRARASGAVVTHGGAISLALAHLLDDDYSNWNRVMHNCAVSELVFAPEPQLLRFNHTAHLEADSEAETLSHP